MLVLPAVHAIILAGGSGRRLGYLAKADIRLAGRRLLDIVLDGIAPVAKGTCVVVAPESVSVPAGVTRTLEDPPGGGPLAGIGAGLAAIGAAEEAWVLVCGVDTPAAGAIAPLLVDALRTHPECDGALVVGGRPEPFRQYLQAIYRLDALSDALRTAGDLRDRGVTGALRVLNLVEVPVTPDRCRDLDTPADLAWWRARMAAS
ncbi:MAG TPA: NTP transferase domain-containing protein [Pseudonocardiaceae bacterium]